MGTKTMTIFVSDVDRTEIPEGEAYQLSIRHPDGSTQQLDICLLYTSPSPRDGLLSRMPSSA